MYTNLSSCMFFWHGKKLQKCPTDVYHFFSVLCFALLVKINFACIHLLNKLFWPRSSHSVKLNLPPWCLRNIHGEISTFSTEPQAAKL